MAHLPDICCIFAEYLLCTYYIFTLLLLYNYCLITVYLLFIYYEFTGVLDGTKLQAHHRRVRRRPQYGNLCPGQLLSPRLQHPVEAQ